MTPFKEGDYVILFRWTNDQSVGDFPTKDDWLKHHTKLRIIKASSTGKTYSCTDEKESWNIGIGDLRPYTTDPNELMYLEWKNGQ